MPFISKILVRPVLKMAFAVRMGLLKRRGIEIGAGTELASGVRLERWTGSLQIGDACRIGQNTHLIVYDEGSLLLAADVVLRPQCYFISNGQLTIGRNTFFNIGCFIGAAEQVMIGADTLFGPHVCIVDNDHSFASREMPIRSQPVVSKPIIIGDGVWIGGHVTVTKGVTIGEGAVIGANAVVTTDIPEYAIAVGIPAKVIRYRGETCTREHALDHLA